jgi:hypothetical protein
MGYGAYMKIVNNSSSQVTTYIVQEQCMYDNGDQGSNLSFFRNLTIQPSTVQPSTPDQGQYIEAQNSGSCFFESSSFTLMLQGLGILQDNLNFNDSGKNWSCTGQPSYINVDINNSADTGTIVITLSNPS